MSLDSGRLRKPRREIKSLPLNILILLNPQINQFQNKFPLDS